MSVPANVVDAWKVHVNQCGLCGNAKSVYELCPIGKNFWSDTAPAPQSAPQPVAQTVPQSVQQPMTALATVDPTTAVRLGQMVASRVVARSSSGAAVAVPMEKTSRSVEIRTSADVMLRMPERDIEVYAEMRDLIGRLLRTAQAIASAVAVSEETRKVVKNDPKVQAASESEVALIVRHARSHFGIGSDESLYQEFTETAKRVLRMGDRLGNFMRVDETTQRIMRAARALAIEMQGEVERSLSDTLHLDDETRRLIKPMRMFAIDLQGEIERRVGTP